MKRRQFIAAASVIGLAGIGVNRLIAEPMDKNRELDQVESNDEYWRSILDPDQYHILFEEGTEPPGSSPLNHVKQTGTFVCAACHQPLFDSKTKYESGTGWPSFYQPIEGSLGTKLDLKLVLPRTEYHCARCGGHQGHVFKDGPQPTGLRYCNNGLALRFIPENEALPGIERLNLCVLSCYSFWV